MAVTGILPLKKYPTYQIALELHPQNGLSVDDCFSKTILYVMNWFISRLEKSGAMKHPKNKFLYEDYPKVEEYKTFSISREKDLKFIMGINIETHYFKKMATWVFHLEEVNNETVEDGITGRAFITEISVCKQESSVILGNRTSCREPVANEKDPKPFRPAFIRSIFGDADIKFAEANISESFAFG